MASQWAAYSTLAIAAVPDRSVAIAALETERSSNLCNRKKVLAIFEGRFIFTPVSFRVDGLPSRVTTELPG
jgi:hypothetical protein